MGYEDAPWVFRGRALYQLQLVKASEAKKYVPDGLHLVSLFGYTLGGFYLARYSDSPVGAFDELVAIAGLVWNPPGSCAWAARVYVNDRTARSHGLQTVGLPSRQATFSPDTAVTLHRRRGWWEGQEPSQPKDSNENKAAQNQQRQGADSQDHPLVLWNSDGSAWWRRQRSARGLAQPVARLTLPPALCGWLGPRLSIPLPSFSGGTEECPDILQYTCQLKTNVHFTKTATLEATEDADSMEALAHILCGRPLLCMNFGDMVMSVDKPTVLLKASERRVKDKRAQTQAA